jgi:hypothetical protein
MFVFDGNGKLLHLFIYFIFILSEEEVMASGSASEFSFDVAKRFWQKDDAKIDFRAQVRLG